MRDVESDVVPDGEKLEWSTPTLESFGLITDVAGGEGGCDDGFDIAHPCS